MCLANLVADCGCSAPRKPIAPRPWAVFYAPLTCLLFPFSAFGCRRHLSTAKHTSQKFEHNVSTFQLEEHHVGTYLINFDQHCCRPQLVLGCMDRPMAQPLLLRCWPVHPGWRVHQGTHMLKKRPSLLALVTESSGLDAPVLARHMFTSPYLLQTCCAHSFWQVWLKQPMFALNQIRRDYLSKPCQKRQGTEQVFLKPECAQVARLFPTEKSCMAFWLTCSTHKHQTSGSTKK